MLSTDSESGVFVSVHVNPAYATLKPTDMTFEVNEKGEGAVHELCDWSFYGSNISPSL